MAKRYVWEWNMANKNPFGSPNTVSYVNMPSAYYTITSSKPTVGMHTSGQNANKLFYNTSGGSSFTSQGTTQYHAVTEYGKYLVFTGYDNPLLCVCPDNLYTSENVWAVGSSVILANKTSGGSNMFQIYRPEITKGEQSFGYVSSTDRNKYPDGYDGSVYWYTYKGYDSIDPTSVSLNVSKIVVGEQVNAIITAPETNLSGDGTVRYYISYSINGGNYTDLGSTTEKIYPFTIPSGTNSLRLKVFARDSQGSFTSDNVYSQTYYANSAPSSPSNVNIPNTVFHSEGFTVSWSTSTDTDGNLSGYEVQCSYNNLSTWSNVGNTSNTSLQTTVDQTYNTVQYRVRAYDSDGAYSGWSYSNIATIQNLRVYVGINGKARKVSKFYIGVSGTAHKIVKGYIGINGIARRFI